jgi:hypothetical protein
MTIIKEAARALRFAGRYLGAHSAGRALLVVKQSRPAALCAMLLERTRRCGQTPASSRCVPQLMHRNLCEFRNAPYVSNPDSGNATKLILDWSHPFLRTRSARFGLRSGLCKQYRWEQSFSNTCCTSPLIPANSSRFSESSDAQHIFIQPWLATNFFNR